MGGTQAATQCPHLDHRAHKVFSATLDLPAAATETRTSVVHIPGAVTRRSTSPALEPDPSLNADSSSCWRDEREIGSEARESAQPPARRRT